LSKILKPERSKLSPEQWEALRQRYENGWEPVPVLCEEYGINHSSLYRHAKHHGWTKRETQPRQKNLKGTRKPSNKRVLIRKLFSALEQRIETMEQHGQGVSLSEESEEKDAKTIAALARTLETLSDMAEKVSADDTTGDERDIERARTDLARRLAALRKKSD
jgi:hypothetical protein